MTIEIALVISAVSLAFGIYSGVSNLRIARRKETQSDATTLTTVIVKLENINNVCAEIKSDISSLKADIKDVSERLVIVEQSAKSAHKRIDEMKGNIK